MQAAQTKYFDQQIAAQEPAGVNMMNEVNVMNVGEHVENAIFTTYP